MGKIEKKLKRKRMKHINDRTPNFYEDDKFYLVRCFNCDRENYSPAVATGSCAWCGWDEKDVRKI